MSNITGDDGSLSSGEVQQLQNPSQGADSGDGSSSKQRPSKKKRNLPGNPDPTADVIALSPKTLMATNRFLCEICNKGFQRDQNLQLHRRGHNLPWKLKQRTAESSRKRVYICPEPSCLHHNPARALGDLTGIKKHYSRKHGEKKWKCEKCSKKYAVQSDWKAHQKTCGTREYKCDCGTIFSRRDSFITHRAFCDALAEENNKVMHQGLMGSNLHTQMPDQILSNLPINTNTDTSMDLSEFTNPLKSIPQELVPINPFKSMNNMPAGGMFSSNSSNLFGNTRGIPSSSSGLQLNNGGQIFGSSANIMSATALLQKAAQMGATSSNNTLNSPMMQTSFVSSMTGSDQLSGSRTSSNFHHNNSFDSTQNEQSNGPFRTQLLHKSPQELAQLFHSRTTGGSAVSDMVMYGGMLVDSDPNSACFLKNVMEQEDNENSGIVQGRMDMGRNPTGDSRLGDNDMMTLDFLGVGGSRGAQNLHEQSLEMEGLNQQRMQVMNPLHQLQVSHGDSHMEKPLWDM
ncbi:protein indeterminate-domain 2-like [Forsythia ovata]|uniref:Protein indeterminate-domain 2-like n=1 Tax=Forsythia ovata TaxID=205694 RepID=A0ABD1T4N6_9LAMI